MTTTEKNTYLEELENAETLIYNYDYDEATSCLVNLAQDLDLYDLTDEYITQDTAEEIAKHEIEKGGLFRLYYFMGGVNFGNCGERLRLNAYGNLEEISKDRLECLASDIRDHLESL